MWGYLPSLSVPEWIEQLHSCVAPDLSIWASVGNTRETEEDVHLRPIQFFRRHVVIPQKGFLPLCKSLAAALRPEVTTSRRHRLRPFHRLNPLPHQGLTGKRIVRWRSGRNDLRPTTNHGKVF